MFEARVLEFMDRAVEANSDSQFVLISDYLTRNPRSDDQPLHTARMSGFSDALHRLATTREDSLYLNLYDAVGDPEAFWDTYLTDGVHLNAAGNAHLAQLTWQLVESVVPEPAAVATGSLVAFGLLLRRRR